MKRGAILLAVAASLVASAGPVSAKGNIPTRSYAVITGPGLRHPIVYVAPWKASVGGYYSGEGEILLALASYSGATPAGRLQTEGGDYVPAGVLPISGAPSAAALGPRYRLTWFRDDVKDVAKQDIYPYAPAGPVVYTFPSSRRALIVLFGRFQDPAHLRTGWGRATSFDLLKFLQAKGLPTVVPSQEVAQGEASPSARPADPPNTAFTAGEAVSRRPGLPVLAISAVILLATLSAAVLWMRRRTSYTAS